MPRRSIVAVTLLACSSTPSHDTSPDAPPPTDATPPDSGSSPGVRGLGMVTDVMDLPTCAAGLAGATCKHVTVRACPDIETEPIGATLATLEPTTTSRGTIMHFLGGGGHGFENLGSDEYRAAGFTQVFVSWDPDLDWEQTAAHGILVAACRPATVMKWIFDNVHAARRDLAFCGQGHSGGSGLLAYALAHYGMGDYLDHVNEHAGPPFARLDLGCNGDAPPTMDVCGVQVTMRLPNFVTPWENIQAPLTCGSTGVPADELQRWHDDSVMSTGAAYDYPHTTVDFFDCTNHATAVTGMAKLYYDEIVAAENDPQRSSYHCYGAADQCTGEGLGTRGVAEAIQAMKDRCVPSHM
jgi:hypothetical protein